MIHSAGTEPEDNRWPPSLGLFNSVVIALTYMRRNRVQEELAETYGTSQSTVSRAISAVTLLIKKVLAPYVPTAEDLDGRRQYLVDGTLLPCWSWAAHPELYWLARSVRCFAGPERCLPRMDNERLAPGAVLGGTVRAGGHGYATGAAGTRWVPAVGRQLTTAPPTVFFSYDYR
jgi:Helix-turn-helix of DDE superfamily endonuclease